MKRIEKLNIIIVLILCIILLFIIRSISIERKLNKEYEKHEIIIDTLWIDENDTIDLDKLLKQQVMKIEYSSNKKYMLLYKYKSPLN